MVSLEKMAQVRRTEGSMSHIPTYGCRFPSQKRSPFHLHMSLPVIRGNLFTDAAPSLFKTHRVIFVGSKSHPRQSCFNPAMFYVSLGTVIRQMEPWRAHLCPAHPLCCGSLWTPSPNHNNWQCDSKDTMLIPVSQTSVCSSLEESGLEHTLKYRYT